ncbi:hypothetical protein D3C85_1639860 [compost metagenome]
MFGVGNGNELDRTELRAQVAGNIEAADGKVGDAFMQYFLDAGQHFLAQAHPATTALRHEGGQGADQARAGIGRVHHQAHFGLPALLHMVGQVLELAGLLDQLP